MDDNNIVRLTFPAERYDEETGELVASDDSVEVEVTRDQLERGVSYFEDPAAPTVANPDGSFTQVYSTVPDPRKDN